MRGVWNNQDGNAGLSGSAQFNRSHTHERTREELLRAIVTLIEQLSAGNRAVLCPLTYLLRRTIT